jgi:D-3-phosphoglycerate dehydrogenase
MKGCYVDELTVVFQSEQTAELQPYDYEERVLGAVGATLRVGRCESGSQLVAEAQGARVIWIEWTPAITREVLEALPDCELVMRWGVGYDQIDVRAASLLGIAVANAPSYCTDTVVEHTFALLLAVTRRIALGDRRIRAGDWGGTDWGCEAINGRTFGVVGLGHIGRRVAALAESFGCHVLASDVLAPVDSPEGVSIVELRQLLEQSDIVSLHVPLSADTEHLLDRERIGWMKPGAVLVNTSRGGVVEEDALVEALQQKRLFGAGLDVFETEPLPAVSRLREIDEVVLTSHEAARSPDSLAKLRAEMCDTTLSWLATGWASSVVNPLVRETRRWQGPLCLAGELAAADHLAAQS